MPFDGSGNYTPAAAPNFPAVSGAAISSTYYNAVVNDLATAMSNCLTRDNQGKPSAAISFNGQAVSGITTLTTTGNATVGGGLSVVGNATVGGTLVVTGALTAPGLSGSNTGDQTITLTGAVTGSGTGSFVTTIPAASITLAQQANMATGSIVYRKTAAAGAPEIQSLATLKTDLGLAGSNSGDQTITLTGVITGSGTGSFATSLTAASVTLASMANVASGSVFYRKTGGAGAPEVQTLAALRLDLLSPNEQTVGSAATVTPTFLNDLVTVTALAVACQFLNPTGTAVNGWGIVLRIKDNGAARALTWDTQYRVVGVLLPTTTVVSKTLYVGMIYNSADTKWDVTSVSQEA